jgi:hypothetical protein
MEKANELRRAKISEFTGLCGAGIAGFGNEQD